MALLLCLVLANAVPASVAAATAVVADQPDTTTTETGGLLGSLVKQFETNPAGGSGEDGEDIAVTARLDVDPYVPYVGRDVRDVIITRLSPFGEVVQDSLYVTASLTERVLNRLTTRTQTWLLENYVLVEPGDWVNPVRLADTERMLRGLSYVSDVRVILRPVPGSMDLVDVVVVVRERFPLGFKLKGNDHKNFDLAVFHRNVGGIGLDAEIEGLYREDGVPEVGRQIRLKVDNLAGAWLTAGYEYRDDQERLEQSIRLLRDFRYPGIRAIGGADAFWTTDRVVPRDDPEVESLRWRDRDLWLGYDARVPTVTELLGRRAHLIVAGRWFERRYSERPVVNDTLFRRFHDRDMILVSAFLQVGEYYRTRLVTGFDQTEDLFSGVVADVTMGWEDGEYRDRLYHGLRVGATGFVGSGDFLSGLLELGAFRERGRAEQGVMTAGIGGFSHLAGGGSYRWRHFLTTIYTLGIGQRDFAEVNLGQRTGIRGLDTSAILGRQRLVANYETVVFTPFAPLGFQTAGYVFLDVGAIGDEDQPLNQAKFYASTGIGVRLKNPRLVFDTVQIQLAYLPTTVEGGSDLELKIGGSRRVSLDLLGPKPTVIGFR